MTNTPQTLRALVAGQKARDGLTGGNLLTCGDSERCESMRLLFNKSDRIVRDAAGLALGYLDSLRGFKGF